MQYLKFICVILKLLFSVQAFHLPLEHIQSAKLTNELSRQIVLLKHVLYKDRIYERGKKLIHNGVNQDSNSQILWESNHDENVYLNKRKKLTKRFKRANENQTRVVPNGNKNWENERNRFDVNRNNSPHEDETQTNPDSMINKASDYVLIAMIVAMMFCMTLCCLCLFCRSSSRLSVCGIDFELNDQRNSAAQEDLSEIHEVVPLTPTTADNNRLPDIESILRSDQPPPLYSELIQKKKEASRQDEVKKHPNDAIIQDYKSKEASTKTKKHKHRKKTINNDYPSQTSSSTSSSVNNAKSWKRNGLFASFRISKSKHARSATQTSNTVSMHASEESKMCKTNVQNIIRLEIIPGGDEEEQTQPKSNANNPNEVFVYDVRDLEDDDVFL